MAIETIGALMAQASSGGTAGSMTRMVELSPLSHSGGSTIANTQNAHQLEVRFKEAVQKHSGSSDIPSASNVPPAMKGLFNALDQINVEAKSVSDHAADMEDRKSVV